MRRLQRGLSKKKVNWKESIKKRSRNLVNSCKLSPVKQNEAPSRALKQICKANQYHSNNEDQLKKIEDQIEEKRAVFEKKLMIAANRTEYQRTNKLFEFNRSTFYWRLDEDQKEIDENIDVYEVITFWKGIWVTDDEEGEYQEMIDLLDPVELQTETEEEKVKKVIEEKIRFLLNWKTPGPEGPYSAYSLKKLTALHFRLTDLLVKAVDDPEQIDGRLYMGTTYLIVKTKRASKGKELRSITCLPNIYKLLSKVVTALVTDLCEVNEVISANLMGTQRGFQGAKQ
ncbi:uncharacterized protein LOC120845751 [Ixodes scapularis]|uniref:uncharacterized protein LOC120845751 n=1 Tax=Ixodes scapularis TaxID=6945 RepID=UPI001A9CCB12|nr:uncharacterized protein LOC120845751 [Ixodes scapularis]